jgi:hypothetical protein
VQVIHHYSHTRVGGDQNSAADLRLESSPYLHRESTTHKQRFQAKGYNQPTQCNLSSSLSDTCSLDDNWGGSNIT